VRLDPVELGSQFGGLRRTLSRALTLLQRTGKVTVRPSRGVFAA